MRARLALAGLLAVALAAPLGGVARAADGVAPGGPGEPHNWTQGDKDGFGSSTSLESKAWLTLNDGELTEVYYPDLGTPSARSLEFVVSDGRSFVEREREDATHEVRLVDRRSLTYRQVNTSKSGRWRLTKTYVTDPARAAVLIDVKFESLTRRPLQLYVLYDPALSGAGDDDSGSRLRNALVASDAKAASALIAAPALGMTSSGYKGTSDGWTDISADYRMDWDYDSAPQGNVVQTGRTALTGLAGSRDLRLALGFGGSGSAAVDVAKLALGRGFERAADAYAAGWHDYLEPLERPASVAGLETEYDVSLMVLAATEDKTFRGGSIASPSMAWVWGNLGAYSGPYHLVWSRDLYQAASAQLAAGDREATERAVDYLWKRQQKPDGCFPQNSNLDGTPHWPNLQLDEVAYPVIMSWQLGRDDADTWAHVESAIGCILANGPDSQERWENADGYSPATIAAEIAALICAAEIAEANGQEAAAAHYRSTADEWQAGIERWTVTTNGPLADHPYYLRLTVDGNADAGTNYTIADGGPTVDQRTVVDPSFLELVRLGVKPADDHQHRANAAGDRPRARREDPQRAVLAPLHPRRLWRDGRRRPVPRHAGEPGHRPALAALRRRARGVRARGRPPRHRAPARDRCHRGPRPHDARAGLGSESAVRRARLRARRGHAVLHSARLDPRSVRAPGLVDRRRPPGGAPRGGGLPLRARVRVTG